MKFAFGVSALLALGIGALAQGISAEQVLAEVQAAWRSVSFHSLVLLDVQQGEQTRSWQLEVWSQGDRALVRVLAPEEEAGSGYLVLGEEVWYYSPEVGSAIQLPPFALAEGAFGGTLALEDVFRGTLTDDYQASQELQDEGYLLVLSPKPTAPVVYGKLELLVRADFALLEIRYFDQRGELLRVARFSGFIRTEGGLSPRWWSSRSPMGTAPWSGCSTPSWGLRSPRRCSPSSSWRGDEVRAAEPSAQPPTDLSHPPLRIRPGVRAGIDVRAGGRTDAGDVRLRHPA